MKARAIFGVALIVVVVVSAAVAGLWRQSKKVAVTLPSPVLSPAALLPSPSPVPELLPSPSPSLTAIPSSIPKSTPTRVAASSVLLHVPFTIQAPDGDWSQPWEDGCEEAALLMADAFNKNDKAEVLPVAATKQKITDMVEWQVKRFGKHKDIGIDEMAIVAKEYLGYTDVTVKHGITLQDIRAELSAGKPVIVPAAGRLLGNPYFKSPGPTYHVFLITGYDGENFIANENGTRQGNDYKYSSAALERALHDYQEGVDITSTPKAYLVLN